MSPTQMRQWTVSVASSWHVRSCGTGMHSTCPCIAQGLATSKIQNSFEMPASLLRPHGRSLSRQLWSQCAGTSEWCRSRSIAQWRHSRAHARPNSDCCEMSAVCACKAHCHHQRVLLPTPRHCCKGSPSRRPTDAHAKGSRCLLPPFFEFVLLPTPRDVVSSPKDSVAAYACIAHASNHRQYQKVHVRFCCHIRK